MNIILIGMRGSGKTTVSKILSEKLKKQHIEIDDLIVEKEKKTIPQIVEKFGWEYFRKMESEIVSQIENLDNRIVSTGGGVILLEKNIKSLKKRGVIFYLVAGIDTLLKRIGDDPNRPKLTNAESRKDEMEKVLTQRQKLYLKCANETINTEILSVEKVAAKILAKFKKYEN